MIKIFGIRHHGPGSARALKQALRAFDPDCLLIEGPADAQDLIPYVADKKLKPPVAMLVYDPKDFRRAGYFPFARFSPEWQAIKWGLKRELPVRFIDWPMSVAWKMEGERPAALFGTAPPKRKRWQRDPLGYLARLAGYNDSERWWDIHFERADNELEIFDLIAEMMEELRSELGPGDDSNLWREAYMRREMRKAVKEGHERIAVICGAWHVPGLAAWERIKAATDNKVFRGIRKTKTGASWIPWSYERLAIRSGYAAGVVSPAWYRLLFDRRQEVTVRFLTRAARLLRREDLVASPAQIIDAVRLAEQLARMRELPLPGIDELREAALSSFCEGAEARLQLIDRRLVVGERVGKVPGNIPMVPLQRDLEDQVRSARLKREYQSSEYITKTLDLRVDSNRKASLLLHRLIALGLPWGTKKDASEGALGSFQESWRLKWKAGFSLKLIESSVYGKTVEEAATNRLRIEAAETDSLRDLSEWAGWCLLGELPDALEPILRRLREVAAHSQDIPALLEALPVLVRIFRYGDVRRTPPEAVGQLIREWIPRVSVGLGTACSALDEDEAKLRFRQLTEADRAVRLLGERESEQIWQDSLLRLRLLPTAAPLLAGGSERLCLDLGLTEVNETARSMRYALSDPGSSEAAAAWLEGFLFGSGLLLIHQESLWQIIDDWISRLEQETFQMVLPLLRRSFSAFPPAERRQLWERARGARISLVGEQPAWDVSGEELVLPILKRLLSRSPSGN